MKTRMLTTAAGLALVLCAFAAGSGASATPPSTPNTPKASVLAVGILDGPAKVKKDGTTLKVRRDTTVRAFDLTYPAGSYSGWHYHPGIVVAVVLKGSVVRELTDCSTQTFGEGQAFTEVGAHYVYNPGTDDAVLKITQILPARDAATPRLELVRPPRCARHHLVGP
jgi:quercetin dioxygenase-like cupin family protein